MDAPRVPGVEAAQALSEVHRRREQVVTGTLVPDWYWTALGAAMLVFIAAVDSGRGWAVGIGTLVFVASLAALVGYVASRQRVQVRNELIGLRGGLAIGGFAVTLVAITLGLSFGLAAAGLPYAATAGGVVTAVGMAVGGPRLMRYLRTLMTSRPIGGRR